MSFANPLLLIAGLLAVALPIVIHILFRRRRRPVRWAAMRFLIEAYRKQRRRTRLEQFLLLLCRCLIVALLAVALGRPLLGGGAGDAQGARTLYVLLDNSIASGAVDGGDAEFEGVRRRAVEAVRELDAAAGDRAALVLLGGPADPVVVPPSTDLAAVVQLIESAQRTDSAADLQGAFEAIASDLSSADDALGADAGGATVLIAGRLRLGAADTGRPLPALPAGVRVVTLPPAQAEIDNISVAAVEPIRSVIAPGAAGDTGQLVVRLVRRGPGVGGAQSVRVRVFVDDPDRGESPAPAGEAVARFSPGASELRVPVTLPAPDAAVGRQVLRAEIDNDALSADNRRRAAVAFRGSLRVGVIASARFSNDGGVARFAPQDWFRLALQPTEEAGGVDLQNIEPAAVDAARLRDLDAAVVIEPNRVGSAGWAALSGYVQRGGLLVITPGTEERVQSWTDALGERFGLRLPGAREARVFETPAAVEPQPDEARAGPLLRLVAPELQALVRPVSVTQAIDLRLDGTEADAWVPLLLDSGWPFLLAAKPPGEGRGLVVLLAVALDPAWTNLQTKPVIVPLLQEIVRQGVGAAGGADEAQAGSRPVLPAGAATLAPLAARGEVRVNEGRPVRPLRDAAAFRVLDDRGGLLSLALINPDIAATDLGVVPPDELTAWLGAALPQGAAAPVVMSENESPASLRSSGETAGGLGFAWPFLLGALLIAAFEAVLARIASHAEIDEATA